MLLFEQQCATWTKPRNWSRYCEFHYLHLESVSQNYVINRRTKDSNGLSINSEKIERLTKWTLHLLVVVNITIESIVDTYSWRRIFLSSIKWAKKYPESWVRSQEADLRLESWKMEIHSHITGLIRWCQWQESIFNCTIRQMESRKHTRGWEWGKPALLPVIFKECQWVALARLRGQATDGALPQAVRGLFSVYWCWPRNRSRHWLKRSDWRPFSMVRRLDRQTSCLKSQLNNGWT